MNSIRAQERIRVHRMLLDAIPQEFTWRRRRYRVQRVECAAPERPEMQSYVLQTVQGLRCRVSHDARQDIWRLEQLLGAGGGLR